MFQRSFSTGRRMLMLAAVMLLGTPVASAQHQQGWPFDGSTSRGSSRGFGSSYVRPAPVYVAPAPVAPASTAPANTSSRAFYPSQDYLVVGTRSTATGDRAAKINVVVRPDAEIWFDDSKMRQTGIMRNFESPALAPGFEYTYRLKATWMENGKAVTRTRNITVRAGDEIEVGIGSNQ
jgi:uncharacterized protein (TIGR03000 family)